MRDEEFKLVICPTYDPKVTPRMRESKREVTLEEGYNHAQAELRGLRWLKYCPNDIVMVVPA